MSAIWARIQREPALVLGLAGAVIALAVSFGADLSTEQTGTILAAVAAVLSLVVRSQVTPNVSVVARLADSGPVAGPASWVTTDAPVAVLAVPTVVPPVDPTVGTQMGEPQVGP